MTTHAPLASPWLDDLLHLADAAARATQAQFVEAFVPDPFHRYPPNAAVQAAQAALWAHWESGLADPGDDGVIARSEQAMCQVLRRIDVPQGWWDRWDAAGGNWRTDPSRLFQECLKAQGLSDAQHHRMDALQWLLAHEVSIASPAENAPKKVHFELLEGALHHPAVWAAWVKHPACPAPNAQPTPVRWTEADGRFHTGKTKLGDSVVEAWLRTALNRPIPLSTLRGALERLKQWDPAAWAERDASMQLTQAIGHRQPTLVQLHLEQGASVEAPGPLGIPPLHFAVNRLHRPSVAALLAAGADPNQPDADGAMPLHHLCYAHDPREPESRSGIAVTPAAKAARQAVAQQLLEAGARWNAALPVPWRDVPMPKVLPRHASLLEYARWRFPDEPLTQYLDAWANAQALSGQTHAGPALDTSPGARRPRL